MENKWKALPISVEIPIPRYYESMVEKGGLIEIIFRDENLDASRRSTTRVFFPREEVCGFYRVLETDVYMKEDYDHSGKWMFVGKCGVLFDYITKDSLWQREESYNTYRFMCGEAVIDVVSQVDPRIEYQATIVVEEEEKVE